MTNNNYTAADRKVTTTMPALAARSGALSFLCYYPSIFFVSHYCLRYTDLVPRCYGDSPFANSACDVTSVVMRYLKRFYKMTTIMMMMMMIIIIIT